MAYLDISLNTHSNQGFSGNVDTREGVYNSMTSNGMSVSLIIERINQQGVIQKTKKGGKTMETFLTVLMALGIYVVLPLIVAAVVCGAVIWRAKLRTERTQEAATGREAKAIVHHPAKT